MPQEKDFRYRYSVFAKVKKRQVLLPDQERPSLEQLSEYLYWICLRWEEFGLIKNINTSKSNIIEENQENFDKWLSETYLSNK